MVNRKGDVEWNTLIPFIIALGVLVLSFVLYMVISGKGSGMLEALKNLIRFGR
ncbi:MAG: hypothetical protein Q8L29_04295 [archaeon]|nr:hypothetical protein [archaeon]